MFRVLGITNPKMGKNATLFKEGSVPDLTSCSLTKTWGFQFMPRLMPTPTKILGLGFLGYRIYILNVDCFGSWVMMSLWIFLVQTTN